MQHFNKKLKIMMRKKMKYNVLLAFTAILAVSCTDLEISESDSIISTTSATGFTGVADPESSLNDLYNSLRGNIESNDNLYALSSVSTDEMLIPTRGTDWGDNGIYRTLHSHTWGPSHGFILNVWNDFNQNIFRASEIIDSRSSPSPTQAAEAKFLRAFSMYVIIDNFGVVPFRQPDEGPEINPTPLSRTEAADFVIQDLNEAIADLPARGPDAGNDRASKAAARFLLAKVLLNKHVYNGSGTPDSGDMNQVISLVDAIAADGFALQAGYFDLFKSDLDNETILFTNSSAGNRIWNGMHYNQVAPDNTGGGWNGFSTLAEFYDLFEGDANSNVAGSGQEERRGFVPDASNAGPSNLGIGYGFLIGQQYAVSGQPLNDRAGAPLVFTKEYPGLVGNNERHGIRVIKYHPVNGAFASHVILFRYADAHLMKAEATMRSGGDPTALVNELRILRNATPLGSVSESDLLAERGRELYNEYSRRNDMIRFGQFTRDWEFKPAESVGDATTELYTIPTNPRLSNPNLVQNPGY
jgi:hypothetical protein